MGAYYGCRGKHFRGRTGVFGNRVSVSGNSTQRRSWYATKALHGVWYGAASPRAQCGLRDLRGHQATDRVKADRRDAGKSAEDLRADSLTAVNLYRDLVRTRASPASPMGWTLSLLPCKRSSGSRDYRNWRTLTLASSFLTRPAKRRCPHLTWYPLRLAFQALRGIAQTTPPHSWRRGRRQLICSPVCLDGVYRDRPERIIQR